MNKQYDDSKVMENMTVARKLLERVFANHENFPDPPDTICLNCGRCVMVGKCCDKPNIVIMEKQKVSQEVWDKIQEVIKNPPEPTKKLRELMTREPGFKREY